MKIKNAFTSNKPFVSNDAFSISTLSDSDNKIRGFKVIYKGVIHEFLARNYNIKSAFHEVENFLKDK